MNNQRLLRPVIVFLIFIGLSLIMRFFSFFPSVLNQDESTYIVLSDTLLAGHTYQVDFIDTKPIGIFLLYALFQLIVGKSIFLLRVIAALVLALTSFFLYRAKLSYGSRPQAALAAGLIYLFLNSTFTFYGISPNTETFFNLFTAIALWMFLRQSCSWKYLVTGLLLGLGFIIKYVLLFDGIALGMFLLWIASREQKRIVPAFIHCLQMAAGAAVPFLVVMLYYWQIGHFEEFWFYSLTVSGRYPVNAHLWDYLKFSLDFFLRFLPFTILYLFVLANKNINRNQKTLGLIWAFFSLIAVLIPGKFFGHYFIQFMLPFSLLAGEFFTIPSNKLPAWLQWTKQPRTIIILTGTLAILLGGLQYLDSFHKRDYPREIADYLTENLDEGEIFYSSNDQITYHLMDQLPPIPHVHPSLFWEQKHIRNLEIDINKEKQLLMEKNPQFLILRKNLGDDRFESWLENYEMVKALGDKIDIYQRKD